MHRTLTRFVSSLSFVFLLAVPLSGVAESMETRGQFIQDAVTALSVSAGGQITLPYKRIPAAMLPAVKAAYSDGALKAFGSGDLLIGRGITRGQAVQVIVTLSGLRPKNTAKTYTDMKANSALSAAAEVAVEQGWIRALRPTLFGADRPLTASEAKALISKVKATLGTGTAPTIHINVIPKPRTGSGNTDLDAVKKLLQQQYLYQDKLKNATGTGAQSLVQSVNDPYTVYFPPAQNQMFQQQIAGEVIGIGVQINGRQNGLQVVEALPGSPAEKAGVLPGDLITAVNDTQLAGLSYEDQVLAVRGPKGSVAKLHIIRNSTTMDITVTRDSVKVPEVTTTKDGNIAVMKISQFGDITDNEIRDDLTKVAADSPRALIIDLRNNPGGLLDAADLLMSGFLPNGSVVANIHAKDGDSKEYTTGDPIIPADLPVMVLVNKDSASAAEIVAGAFQDYKRATIVGETSYGKGTVQQLVEFQDGSSLKMTIAEWRTPKDRKIDKIGVIPDVVVDSSQDPDAAMTKALQLLQD